MATVSVRYIVDDVDRAIEFYAGALGFGVPIHSAPNRAVLRLGPIELILSLPGTADGELAAPGGWNRIRLEIADIETKVDELRRAGAGFRGQLVESDEGRHILLEDPAGNLVELVQPTVGEGLQTSN